MLTYELIPFLPGVTAISFAPLSLALLVTISQHLNSLVHY